MFSKKPLAQTQNLADRAADQVNALAQRGVDGVLDASHLIRDRALRASDSTVGYIKDEPVKAMLIAAVAGAALMAIVSLLGRSRYRG
ncbi:hypothetical protein [Rhodoferax ferrireducens]|uniref:hypothetical protein n=1 Tax=Rhodoferax ferrireducens TaxID=192843 RepID=UPI000E0CE440|nr:hypothetical protein [Rhodoferax ferrireducens]